jgi:endonuclease/exonuclease/phosphatase family metal-dependent hydrolase
MTQNNNNQDLYVTLNKPVTEFKFLQYNVDMAVREEQFENTKWISRKDRVTKLVNEVDADIVCLQEMRQLPNNDPINKFLSGFDRYQYDLGYRNASTLSFGQATLYKPEKFYAMKTVKQWISDTSDVISDTYKNNTGFGYLVLGTKFYHVHEGKIVKDNAPFWVFNTHFGLDEGLKTYSCKKLVEIVKNIAGNDNVIISGDFNFFPDRDEKVQRSILTEHFNDSGVGAKTLSGKEVIGTFVGYEHDNFKASFDNMVSRLDNVFTGGNVAGTNPILYTKTMLDEEPEEFTTRNYPSDHLPLVVTMTLGN